EGRIFCFRFVAPSIMARSAPASDRDSSPPTIRSRKQQLRPDTPNLQAVPVTMSFVDSGYQGDEAQRAAYEASRITITVVKRTDTTVKGFIVLPKRWVVERTLGWINRARRLSKDFEATIESSLAWLQLALAFLLMRRIARKNEAV